MTADQPQAGRRRVLVVDDEERIVKFVVRMLQISPLGLDVRSAPSAEEACRVAGEIQPELVIIDVHLASGTGTRAVDEIRRHLANPCEVLMMSGDLEALQDLDADGSETYLWKPFTSQELLAKTAGALGATERAASR